MSLKMTHVCGNPSFAVLLFRYKCSSGRSVSDAAPHFGTYVCMNPALFRRSLLRLWKKPYDSWKKPSNLQKKPSSLRWRHAVNTFRKGIPNSGINFKDAYRTSSKHTHVLMYIMIGSVTAQGSSWLSMRQNKLWVNGGPLHHSQWNNVSSLPP